MNNSNGYNPLRWNCSERGCFNVLKRPKIEVFAKSLPGRIAFSDVDAAVEVNGRFLFLEFKEGEPRELQTGQRLFFQRLTLLSPNIQTVVVFANAETMVVTHIRSVRRGIIGDIEPLNLDGLCARINLWSKRAAALPSLRLVAKEAA